MKGLNIYCRALLGPASRAENYLENDRNRSWDAYDTYMPSYLIRYSTNSSRCKLLSQKESVLDAYQSTLVSSCAPGDAERFAYCLSTIEKRVAAFENQNNPYYRDPTVFVSTYSGSTPRGTLSALEGGESRGATMLTIISTKALQALGYPIVNPSRWLKRAGFSLQTVNSFHPEIMLVVREIPRPTVVKTLSWDDVPKANVDAWELFNSLTKRFYYGDVLGEKRAADGASSPEQNAAQASKSRKRSHSEVDHAETTQDDTQSARLSGNTEHTVTTGQSQSSSTTLASTSAKNKAIVTGSVAPEAHLIAGSSRDRFAERIKNEMADQAAKEQDVAYKANNDKSEPGSKPTEARPAMRTNTEAVVSTSNETTPASRGERKALGNVNKSVSNGPDLHDRKRRRLDTVYRYIGGRGCRGYA